MFWKKEEPKKPVGYQFHLYICYKNALTQSNHMRGFCTETAAESSRDKVIETLEGAMKSGVITEFYDGMFTLGSEIIAFEVHEVTRDRYFYEYKQY